MSTIDLKYLKIFEGVFVPGRESDSPSWQRSPLTPGGQRQLPLTGSQVAPFLHLQRKEQFLPKNPSEQAAHRHTHTRAGHAWREHVCVGVSVHEMCRCVCVQNCVYVHVYKCVYVSVCVCTEVCVCPHSGCR